MKGQRNSQVAKRSKIKREPTFREQLRIAFVAPIDNHLAELRCEEDSERVMFLLHPDNYPRLLVTGLSDVEAKCYEFLSGIFESAGGETKIKSSELNPGSFGLAVSDDLRQYFRHDPSYLEQYSSAYERFYSRLDRYSSDTLGNMLVRGLSVLFDAVGLKAGLLHGGISSVAEAVGAKNSLDREYSLMMQSFSGLLAAMRESYLEMEDRATLLIMAYQNAVDEL